MRLKLFTAISLLAAEVCACYIPPYTPADTYIYRIMEDVSLYSASSSYSRYYLMRDFDFCDENLRLWREQTGTRMPDEILRILIYGNNATIDRIGFRNCPEANECLETIKNVQDIRKAMADPWYFPSSSYNNGKYTLSLEELVDKCKERAHGMFRGRYVLQGLRSLNTLRRWEEAVDLWEQQKDSMTADFIYTMAEREAAAAYLRQGNDSIAASIYSRIGDIASLRMCNISRNNEMEYIYEHCPDSPYLPEEIQNILLTFDRNHTLPQWEPEWETQDSLPAKKFLNLCLRVIRECRVKNPAMWYYAAAATLDALSRPSESLPFIRKGERLTDSEFLRKSFRLLRIHIEAQTSPLSKAYERQLLRDLRWVCHEIDANMNDAEKRNLRKLTNYKWSDNTYFWNDAMRRIILSDLCPRLVEAGKTQRALQLTNFADYYMFKKLGNEPLHYIGWQSREWDDFSYSSALFEMADSLSASQLADYVLSHKKSRSDFDRFLASGSNLDATYWCDIVGTHYLRENNYTEAERWLARLPKDYEQHTNIYRDDEDYFMRNPFDLSFNDPNYRRSRLSTTTNYKLDFARKMAQYEHDMQHAPTADLRGMAKVYYAAGLRNQMDYCWALTSYSHSCYSNMEWDENYNLHDTEAYASAKRKCHQLIEEGLADISDYELKACLLHAMRRNLAVVRDYPTTLTAHLLYLRCDTWRDYLRNNSQ